MSFNPSDFITYTDDIISTNQINQLNAIYLKKTEFDTSNALTSFNNDITIGSNLICNNVSISKDEIEKLNNIDVNIKTRLTELSNNINGVFNNNNTYTGDGIYLGSSNFNNMSLTTNGITKVLNSYELSQLDNINSNIQTQLNNKTNLILNPINNNIVSMDINGQLKNNDVKINNDVNLTTISNNEIPSTNVLKNYVENKINNISMNTAIGRPKILYLSDVIDTPTGYETMNFIPINDPEDIENIVLNNNRVLFHSYITTNPLNISKINAGLWSSYIYGYVDDATSTTRYELDLYVRTSLGIETLFLSMVSNDINNLSVNAIQFNATLNSDVNINLTDKLVIKVYGFSNANKNITLYLYHGGNIHNSFINTSIIESHNDLNGLNIGDFQHLTQLQKIKATQLSSNINDGLLSSSDWNMFNNKENFINTDNSTLKYFRGDKTFQLLDKNSVGLGNVDNTSDINKPISTLTQTALNLKNDIINSSTNLSVNTISDITGNLRTAINELTNKWYQVLFCAGQFGLDTNNGYQMNKPKKTIQNCLDDSNANSGVNIIILPWVYNEVITISRQNITLSSLIYEKGGLCSITNDVNITSVSSSVRLSGLSLVNLTITGNCSVYIDNCKISGTLNKSVGTGYMEINNSSLSGQILLNSNSINNFLNNNISGTIINNVGYNSLQCNFSNNLISGISLNLNSGVWGFNNSVIYSTSSSTNSLLGNGIYLYLSNMNMLNPDNTNAKITLINSYYSINNSFYNKSSSVFTNSTKLNRLLHNEQMNIDTLLLNNELNLNGLGSLSINELYYLDGCNSNIQLQLNNSITLNGIQTLTNKTLTEPILSNNIIKSQSNNNITIPDVNDTLVNLSTIQTLTNKTLTDPKLTNNRLLSSTNNIITFIDVSDTIVNLNSNQTLTNKSLTTPKLTNNIIKSSTDNNITIIDSVDTLVNLNSIQTLTNKTLNNCVSNTPSSNDNSTKIATTEFVKFFSAPQKWSGVVAYTDTFIFGNFRFTNTNGALGLSTTIGPVNVSISTDLIYTGFNVGSYMTSYNFSSLGLVSQMVSSNVYFVSNPGGRTLNGHFCNLTNSEYYRFSVMTLNNDLSLVIYYVEKLV